MKKLFLTSLFIGLFVFAFADVEYWPEAGIYLAKYNDHYLRTYDNSKVVHKCYGFAAADHFKTKAEAEKLVKLYKEQRM